MSEAQHLKDSKEKLRHEEKGEGACLNRHLAGTPQETVGQACSHRWQSYKATQKRKKDYDYPKYKSLCVETEEERDKQKFATSKNRRRNYPPWYTGSLRAPLENSWDVAGDNFFTKCTIPYWHEAHHAIPNSVLRKAIDSVVKEFDAPDEATRIIRGGLLDEGYNLNHHENMITLPMDRRVSDAIDLPTHRQTAMHRNHPRYNRYVEKGLKRAFTQLKRQADVHETPEYKPLKMKLVRLSKRLIKEIRGGLKGKKPATLELFR